MKKDKMATTKMIFIVIFTVVLMEGSSGRVIKKDKGFGEVCGGLENKYGVCEHGFECNRETVNKKGTCGCFRRLIPIGCIAQYDSYGCFTGCKERKNSVDWCNPKKCASVNCIGGTVNDKYNCCEVCAQTIGEDCGPGHNPCDKGLRCEKRKNETSMRCVDELKKINEPCGGDHGKCEEGLKCNIKANETIGTCGCLRTRIPQDCGALFDNNGCFTGCRPFVPFLGGCNLAECTKVNCAGGTVKDENDCCDVCAQTIGEECGPAHNPCGNGLRCEKRKNETSMRCVEELKKINESCGGDHGKCDEGLKCNIKANETIGTCGCLRTRIPQDCWPIYDKKNCFTGCRPYFGFLGRK